MQYGGKFIQVDSIAGHLTPGDEVDYLKMVDSYRRSADIPVIGGVRFKYQPYLSGRSLAEDLRIGMQHCDAIAVTGSGTGVETDNQKIAEFRCLVWSFPLVVAAGMPLPLRRMFEWRSMQVLLPFSLHGGVDDDADQFGKRVESLAGNLFQQFSR